MRSLTLHLSRAVHLGGSDAICNRRLRGVEPH